MKRPPRAQRHGKTTLLNLLSCVLRSDFSPLREEAFEVEFALVSERASVTAWLRHSLRPELSADPTFPSDAAWTLAYRIAAEGEGAPRVVVDSNGETATLLVGDSPARGGPPRHLPRLGP